MDAFIGPITQHAWLTMAVYFGVLLLCVKPLGMYIANVMQGKLGFAARIENVIYRICGVRASEEMHWSRYAISLLVFSLFGALAVYALQRLQVWLPLNPQQMANVTPDSSFNTAVSFVTNTNWQGYAGEATMSYLTQMLGLAVQNFLSAASGIVVVIALIRGLARHSMNTIGNVWVDLTRVTLFILLPISFVLALALVSQGAIQSFDAYQEASTLDVTSYETAKLDADGQPVKGADVSRGPSFQPMPRCFVASTAASPSCLITFFKGQDKSNWIEFSVSNEMIILIANEDNLYRMMHYFDKYTVQEKQ